MILNYKYIYGITYMEKGLNGKIMPILDHSYFGLKINIFKKIRRYLRKYAFKLKKGIYLKSFIFWAKNWYFMKGFKLSVSQ